MKRTSIQTLLGNPGVFSGYVCAQFGAYAFVVSAHRPPVGEANGGTFAP